MRTVSDTLIVCDSHMMSTVCRNRICYSEFSILAKTFFPKKLNKINFGCVTGNVNHNYTNNKKSTRIRNTVSYMSLTHLFRNIVFLRSDVTEDQKKMSLCFPVLIYCSNPVGVFFIKIEQFLHN